MTKGQLKTGAHRARNRKIRAENRPAEPHVNRHRMAVTGLTARGTDVKYWRSQSASARLAYMEYLRLINYGQAATSGRLKRVFEIAQRRPR